MSGYTCCGIEFGRFEDYFHHDLLHHTPPFGDVPPDFTVEQVEEISHAATPRVHPTVVVDVPLVKALEAELSKRGEVVL